MADTYSITRNAQGLPTGAIELVDSPDDGGWYAHEYDFQNKRDRASVRIYRTRSNLAHSLRDGRHRWEKWR